MRDQPVEHAAGEQAASAEEAPVDDPGQKAAGDSSSEGGASDPESEQHNDDLFVDSVDQRVTDQGMRGGKKSPASIETKGQQVNRSLKAMESSQENSLLSSTEEPICPPPEKRHKVSSDKDGEQCDSDRHSSECASQIVPYKHDKSGGVEDEQGKELIASVPSKRKRQRSLPIEAYTAQCAACNEWRLVPTKKKYEEIRECTKENPFTCEKAREWKPDVACHDPSEVSQDGSKLWAMDQHNIPQSAPGWERLIMIRREGCSKFADVYYTSPTGRKLRSTNEVASYLKENPEYEAQGVKLSQFSFKIPTPARLDNVRKSNWTSRNDVTHEGSTKPLPEEVQAVTGPAPQTHEDAGDNNQLVPYNEDPPELLQQYRRRGLDNSPQPPAV